MNPDLVVSAGTYHLPFTRLIEWTESWLVAHPGLRVVVQHGPTRPVVGAENHASLPYGELLDLYRTADVLVLQGGAGGIMDCRALGRRPIVVPRVPIGGEVVDDHQLRFVERAEALGLVHRALAEAQLHRMVDDALAGRLPTRFEHPIDVPGVAVVGDLLGTLPESLPSRERLRRAIRSAHDLIAERIRA